MSFFGISKIAWLLLAPSNLFCILLILGLLRVRVTKKAGRVTTACIMAGVLGLALAAFSPLPSLFLGVLEARFTSFAAPKHPVTGIILLGGAISGRSTVHGYEADIGEPGDRVREAARLAHRYPDARLVIAAGVAKPRAGQPTEATELARLLEEYGVAGSRLELEQRSRTTAENARLTAVLVRPAPDELWILVTSASHMPRAVGAFRHAGFSVVAAPADWRSDTGAGWFSMNASENLAIADLAAKEYLGLVAYRLSGRSDVLFPAPAPRR